MVTRETMEKHVSRQIRQASFVEEDNVFHKLLVNKNVVVVGLRE